MTLYDTEIPWESPAIGLRTLKFSDGPAGVARGAETGRPRLLTPCGIGLGASWDTDLLRRVGELVGDEARSREVDVIHAPNLNLIRGPLGGRNFEQYSEDPWLVGLLGAAWIEGLQSRNVAAVAKHLVCNDSETDRQTMNSVVDDRVLRETYLVPFELAVRAGVWGVMAAYNRVNGTYCAEHPFLINGIGKSEWRFDGFVISDAGATHSTVASALAGLDLELPGPGRPQRYGEPLAAAVRQGLVDESVLDAAVERLLLLAHRVGKLGDKSSSKQPGAVDARGVLHEAAAASFVLLKNERNLLPITPGTIRTIAVLGPNAASPCFQGGAFSQISLPEDIVTPLAALQGRYAESCSTVYALGAQPSPKVPPLDEIDLHTPGDPSIRGLSVEYLPLEADGNEPLAREIRSSGSMIWMAAGGRTMPGFGATDRPGRVHASAIMRPRTSGPHQFFAGSSGELTVRVGGQEVIRQGEQPPIDDMGALMRPQVLSTERNLTAGETVAIDLDMHFGPSRAHSLHFGCRPPSPAGLLDQAVELAASSDVAVVIVGETQDTSLESADRTDTRLPGPQVELIRRVCEVNANTVVVVNTAHAVDMEWADRAAAVLLVWFPGQEFGPALAAVLCGDAEPGGRLPVTVARVDGDYPVFDLTPNSIGDLVYEESPNDLTYQHLQIRGTEPRFPFGHGLGYADFEYQTLEATVAGGDVRVDVTLRNTSQRPGKEVIQLYVRGPLTEGSQPAALRAFAAPVLQPGETRKVRLVLDRRSFSRWSTSKQDWETLSGAYEILVGRSVSDIRLSTVVGRA